MAKRAVFVAVLASAFAVVALFLGSVSANAAITPMHRQRVNAYLWAAHQRGCPYVWGGTGPCRSGFDCSGLVMRAWHHAGVWLPRTTYEMLNSRHLVRIPARDRRRGDLAFYGSGHVELVHWRHSTLGAPEPGENVRIYHWRWDSSYHPTAFYRVR